ncbi:MAG: heparan-alpha-glucosaminide N-acetyltransferase [Bauldia sp.]
MPAAAAPRAVPRIAAIDLARGIAIVAMVVYHTCFDLSADGLIAADVESDLPWKIYARLTAGTFLVLVGIALVLASRGGIDWRRYLRRLAFIAAGAALVTVATVWFDRSTFVFFGILHEIAVASVLALPFLWAPVWLTAIVAAAIVAAPWFLAAPIFDQPWLWWVGLSPEPPPTVDYVPLLPWFGIVLAGVAAGRVVVRHADALARFRPTDAVSNLLMLAGRWSLAIYLIHQPLIVGALYVFTLLHPPGVGVIRERWVGQCTTACVGDRDAPACTALCGCLFDGLYGTDLFRAGADMTDEQQTRWDAIVDRCRTPQP